MGDGRPMMASPARTVEPSRIRSRSATPTAKPTRSNSPGLHGAGVLGHLAADERAARLAATLGHPGHQLVDVVGVERADRDVVEEEERLGAGAGDVVDAHGHEVDADRVEAVGLVGDHRLGARRRRWTRSSTGCSKRWAGNWNRPPKPPMSPMTSGRNVDRTWALMRSTAASPASMSTPAPAYVSPASAGVGPPSRAGSLLAGHVVEAELAGELAAIAALGHGGGDAARGASTTRLAGRADLEHALAEAHGDVDRVVAGEAGVAEPALRGAGGGDQPVEGEVGDGVDLEVLADLLEIQVGGEQLAADAGVDAEEARPHDRRGGDPQVDLGRPGLAQHLGERPLRGAADDGVVDHHDPLARQVLPQRVELHAHRGGSRACWVGAMKLRPM